MKIIDKIRKYSKYIWLLPVVYGFAVIILYGVNVLWMDEWDSVHIYEYVEQNGWLNITLLKLLFSPHNEHIQFFPRIILLISHRLFHFNTKVDMFIIQLMVLAVYVTCIKYFKNKQDIYAYFPYGITILFILLTGFACFSSIQFGNFLWGFQVGFYMAIFAAVISLYYFHQYFLYTSRKNQILSILFGIIASFSSAHGVIVWPVIIVLVLICLFLQKRNMRGGLINNSIPHVTVGIICCFVYLYVFKFTVHHQERNIYSLAKYFFGSIGGMYTSSYSRLTIVLGGATLLLGIILALIFLFKRNIKAVLFPIGLIGYSCASLFVIAFARIGLGIETSTHSRYLSISLLLFIGVIMLIYQFFLSDNGKNKISSISKKKKVFFCIITFFSVFLLYGNFRGFSLSRGYSVFLNERVSMLQNYERQPIERLALLYPFGSYENVYDRISKLRRYRLNVFSNALYSHDQLSVSRIDGLNRIELNHYVGLGKESFKWDNRFIYTKVWGDAWAIDYVNQREYTQVYMRVNNELYRTADHLSSPDVLAHYKNVNYGNVRFSFSLPISEMNIGENNFSAIVILNDGISYYESEKVTVFLNVDGGISFNPFGNEEMNSEIITKIIIPHDISEIVKYDISLIDFNNGNLILQCGIDDPQVFFQLQQPITKPAGGVFIKIGYISDRTGNLQIYYNFGEGLSERNSYSLIITESSVIKEVYYPIMNWEEGKSLVSIRVDPPDGSRFEIGSIEIMKN